LHAVVASDRRCAYRLVSEADPEALQAMQAEMERVVDEMFAAGGGLPLMLEALVFTASKPARLACAFHPL